MKNNSGAVFWGGLLILIGAGALAGNLLPEFNFWDVLGQWWPLLIVILGTYTLFTRSNSILGSVITIIIGLVLLTATLGLLQIDFWAVFWPVILILVGAMIIFNNSSRRTSDANSLNEFRFFSGVEKKLTSDKFTGGDLVLIFGAADIDLREAKVAQGAELNITTMFGGAEIKVNENCEVDTNGTAIFGGWEDNTKHKASEQSHKLTVKGISIFGAVEVRN